MMRRWHVRLIRCAVVPCPLVLLLTACTPGPGGLQLERPGVGPSADSGIFPSSSAQGRFYALGQALAYEQQRSATLQAQLDERGRQIERLQGEVQKLGQQESDLQAALDRATAAQAAAQAAAGTQAGGAQRRGRGKRAAGEQTSEEGDEGGGDDQRERAATTASLRTALAKELLRREAAESELTRLKAETSTPALADVAGSTNAAELAAAKQEVVDLRGALDTEREARARLAEKLQKLEQRTASNPAPDTSAADADMRARLQTLEAERQAAVESFNRGLAASQDRAAELERQLAATRAASAASAATAPAVDGSTGSDLTSIRAENSALRERLDDEHRRTEQLSAKLKLATRVTDLIFKMQSQQGQAPQGQAPQAQSPRSDPWLDR